MDHKMLFDAMSQLKARMTDREHFAMTITQSYAELNRLDGEIYALKGQVIAMFAEPDAVAAPAPKKGRPKGRKDAAPRKAASLISKPAAEVLETIKASGPEGVPAEKLHVKPWVFGVLARTGKARKVNGNWIAT